MSEPAPLPDAGLVLHGGMPKTGTTALQHGLTAAEADLRARGLDYIAPLRTRNPSAHHDLPLAFLEGGAARRAARGALLGHLRRATAPRLLVSSEGLINLFRPGQLGPLTALLSAAAAIRPVRIVIGLRRIDDFFLSMYLHQIKVGTASGPVETYLAGREAWARRFFRALATLRELGARDGATGGDGAPGGAGRITLDLPAYRPGGDFLTTLLPRLGLTPEEATLLPRDLRPNRRLGLRAQTLLAHLDRFGAETGLVPVSRLRLVRYLEEEGALPGDETDYDLIEPGRRQALRDAALAAARTEGIGAYAEAFAEAPGPERPFRRLDWALLTPAGLAALAEAGRAAGVLVPDVSRAKHSGAEPEAVSHAKQPAGGVAP
jgi:hypothetical protein